MKAREQTWLYMCSLSAKLTSLCTLSTHQHARIVACHLRKNQYSQLLVFFAGRIKSQSSATKVMRVFLPKEIRGMDKNFNQSKAYGAFAELPLVAKCACAVICCYVIKDNLERKWILKT